MIRHRDSLGARRAKARREFRVARSQLVKGTDFGNARAGDTDCPVRPPSRLERQRRVLGASTDAEAVAEIDQRSVAGVGPAIAAVVGARHVGAGLVERAQRRSTRLLLPRPIAPTDALADRPAGTCEIEAAASVRHREAEAPALRVRRTQVGPLAGVIGDDEMVQHDTPADGVRIVLHALDRDRDLPSAGRNGLKRINLSSR
jgi:hypothetical protein